ncbi:hypothetical protein HGI30_15050 [Paenibacillus albicereus]|uniref:Uncharacterized protein n=1 Tax=Paenibacillus albicereus TaxID=2726185 RepID=A0A6H2GZA8_9BACL|nr:hypothetical protein [Paenibacillus albicereus]QJC52750.1 hypothetical protein HGI30_15050 [Paenibacillus albicereus]
MVQVAQLRHQCSKYPYSATENRIVTEMINNYDAKLIQVTEAAERLQDNVIQLRNEQRRLMDEVDAAREQTERIRLTCIMQIIELAAAKGIEKARAIDRLYQIR